MRIKNAFYFHLKQFWQIIFIEFFLINVSYSLSCPDLINKLSNRYNNTSSKSYLDSGVFVHTFDDDSVKMTNMSMDSPFCETAHTSNKPLWCPNNNGIKRGSISFSWIRKDIVANSGPVIFPLSNGGVSDLAAGYIFNLNLSSKKRLDVLCAYPTDGGSDGRTNNGCGRPYSNISSTDNNFTNQYFCKEILNPNNLPNIDMVQLFNNKYNNPAINNPCAVSPDNFSFFIDLARQTKYGATAFGNNEIVIKSWQGVSYNQIPIEAFFYVAQGNNPTNLTIALNALNQFNASTSLTIPLVRIDINAVHARMENPFSCPNIAPEILWNYSVNIASITKVSDGTLIKGSFDSAQLSNVQGYDGLVSRAYLRPSKQLKGMVGPCLTTKPQLGSHKYTFECKALSEYKGKSFLLRVGIAAITKDTANADPRVKALNYFSAPISNLWVPTSNNAPKLESLLPSSKHEQ